VASVGGLEVGARQFRPCVRQRAASRVGATAASQSLERHAPVIGGIRTDRRALLLGSALASTLLFAAPGQASAQQAVFIPTATSPVVTINTHNCIFPGPCVLINTLTPGAFINFTNLGNFLSGGIGISATTVSPLAPIAVQNFGDIATAGLGAIGIATASASPFSPIAVLNAGDIATVGVGAIGISADSASPFSPIAIINSGDIATLGVGAIGIQAASPSPYSPIYINNSGDIATKAQSALGISANANSAIRIENSGDIVTSGDSSNGISASTGANSSPISIVNSGEIQATGSQSIAISATTSGSNSSISIDNSGELDPNFGIYAKTVGDNSPITITSSNSIIANRFGMYSQSGGGNSAITIDNSSDITARTGILAKTSGNAAGSGGNAGIGIHNQGDIVSNGVVNAGAIYAVTLGNASGVGNDVGVTIDNSGDLTALRGGIVAGAFGNASGVSNNAGVAIENAGRIEALYGIYSVTKGNANGAGSNVGIDITNAGDIEAGTTAILARVYGSANGAGSSAGIHIENSGTAFGGSGAGIYAHGNAPITIVNSGYVSATSLLAINAQGAGSTNIINFGLITGYVMLDADDTFTNENGGTFEARLTSDFGGGSDLLVNESGATLHTAADSGQIEHVAFINLERFENQGLISLQDNEAGDTFEISDTVGQRNLAFSASGNSTLAVDTFLGGPGSISDTFTINGNVSGQTLLTVHNTNPGPAAFNDKGIPVVYVNGNVKEDAFFLKKPIDAGFFDYDLFFKPTGSGIFYLKSVPGGGSHVLPHLVTNIEDVFHTGTETWFDRTADLRVLLNGGAPYQPPSAQDPTAPGVSITPAVWARGSGAWLGREGSETTQEYGRTYQYKLDSDLSVENFQMGIDFGKRDFLSQGDILVFGLLGGWVHGDLNFDGVNRQFDLSGGQAGAYATYLKGGLFIDTLFKADILSHGQKTVEFPDSLGATSFGVRTDTGYRFGSFRHGAFIEPLATIGVIWSDLEDFTLGPNHVDFDSDPNVRGRLGLRLGSTMRAWAGTMMEPFVIGSVWSNLSGETTATLTSNRTTFNFEDRPEDVWGEASAGVNFFNPSANTSVFAKFDATFGDNLEGFGGKAGMRVSW